MGKKKSDNTVSIRYKSIGKKTTLLQELAEVIPKEFRPTNKTSSILITIFVIIIGIGIINAMLPIMDLSFDMSTEEAKNFKLDIKVGLPFEFFGNSADTNGKIKLNATNFILDMIIYLLISYILDVMINFLFTLKIGPNKAELKKKPKEFKLKSQGISGKATDKVVEKVAKKIIGKTPAQPTTTQTQAPILPKVPKQETPKQTAPAQETKTKPITPKVQPVPKY